jgi:hypothetical protein
MAKLVLVTESPRKFHKRLLRQLKKLRNLSSLFHVSKELSLTQFKAKMQLA